MERRNRFDGEIMERALRDYHAGRSIKEICQLHGISKSSFYYWLSKHGDNQSKQDERMAALKAENAKLRHILANRVLEILFDQGKAAVGTKELERLLDLVSTNLNEKS